MILPDAKEFETADQWLAELHRIGKELGAVPLGPLAIGRLAARGNIAEFWNAIEVLGDKAPLVENNTIEDQLRAAYEVIKNE